MRKPILSLTLLLVLALLPGSSALAQALQLDGGADCETWSALATLTFPSGVFSGDLSYSIALTDAGGAEVARFEATHQINRFENPVMVMMYDDLWGLTLDSNCTTAMVFRFLGEEVVQNIDLACGPVDQEPTVEPCHHTFKYWRKHTREWPVDELVIGGELYSKRQLLRLLEGHGRSHFDFSLARHLVATQLNLLNGTETSILPIVEAAESFLVRQANTHRNHGRDRHEARELQRALLNYNNLSCDGSTFSDRRGDHEGEKTFADESVSFDSMKAMYR